MASFWFLVWWENCLKTMKQQTVEKMTNVLLWSTYVCTDKQMHRNTHTLHTHTHTNSTHIHSHKPIYQQIPSDQVCAHRDQRSVRSFSAGDINSRGFLDLLLGYWDLNSGLLDSTASTLNCCAFVPVNFSLWFSVFSTVKDLQRAYYEARVK